MAHITDNDKAERIVEELTNVYAHMDRLSERARELREALAELVKPGNASDSRFGDIS